MSKIRFFALGGLGENGKNMYVVDVDNQLFILDSGIKYPGPELFGVDEIIPDYKMLIRVKKNIKGLFLTHAHEDHIGAIIHLLKDLDIDVYATNFTMNIVKDALIEANYDLQTLKLHIIDQDNIIKFGNVKVSFFNTTHSIPESIGVVVHTIKGAIVYTSDYTFQQTGNKHYQTDFQKINEIGSNNVLALLTESLGSELIQNSADNLELNHRLNEIYLNSTGRIIVSLFSSDLQKIQRVVDISLQHNKRIAIIGRRAQRIVDIAIRSGYLNIPEKSLVNLRFIDDKVKNDDKDIVALVTGSRHEPFYMLQRMCKKADRLIHINENDTVVFLTAPVPGTEKMAARTLDVLYRSDAHVSVIDKRLLSQSHATGEEIKLMINLLKPQYIIPVIGEYRMQYRVKKLAMELDYKSENIFLLDNGDVLNFTDKPFVGKQDISTGEILLDGSFVGDVNDYVVRDRELLSEDGALLIVAHVSPKKKAILSEIQIVSRGFVYHKPEGDLLEEIKQRFHKVSEKHLTNKYINWAEYKKDVRNDISKYIYQETRRNPITIPVIISTDL